MSHSMVWPCFVFFVTCDLKTVPWLFRGFLPFLLKFSDFTFYGVVPHMLCTNTGLVSTCLNSLSVSPPLWHLPQLTVLSLSPMFQTSEASPSWTHILKSPQQIKCLRWEEKWIVGFLGNLSLSLYLMCVCIYMHWCHEAEKCVLAYIHSQISNIYVISL